MTEHLYDVFLCYNSKDKAAVEFLAHRLKESFRVFYDLWELVPGRPVQEELEAALEKSRTYECGEIPTGSAWINMNPRFYLIALIFLIFDVEIAFIFPVATVFRQFLETGQGLLVLGEILVFVLILFAGLIFVWGRGDLEWLKAIAREDDSAAAEEVK